MPKAWKQPNVILGSLAAGSLLGGLLVTQLQGLQTDALAQTPPDGGRTPTVNQQNLAHAESLSQAFRNVADAIRPSVVSISTKQTQVIRGRALPPGLPPEFEQFFGNPGPMRRESNGMGSGVIVRPDGYILTNNHVVEDAEELEVQLYDGQTVPGEVIGTDPETDLAVVKIDVPNLQAAPIGRAETVRVGDWVLAIGNPFGLEQTVTAGIISGKNRVRGIIAGGDGFEDFLQTDAAINPGNSGGPLVNLRGEMIGINTAILSRSGASAGIGFAIPVSLAEPVLNSIIETGEVHRGFLGAQVVDVTPERVKDFALEVRSGALIAGVLEDQPAAKAGIQPGDVVTELDGRPCTSGTQLRNYVASRRPGTTVRMLLDRSGEEVEVRVKLGERTAEALAMFDAGGGLFGAELEPVTPETARQYGYDNLRSGLIITAIQDGGLAAQAGLEVGDVIETAGRVKLRSVEQLVKIYTQAKEAGEPIQLIIRRGDRRFLLPVN